jgi:prepilin-type N-terminal cleavage/methylation domain-containing protein/prepilin-type processing-associated H-X9-DG protein
MLGATMKRSAFTLVELLVVVTIIVTLLSMLAPSLSGAYTMTRKVCCMSQLKDIGKAVEHYVDNNHQLLPRSKHSAKSKHVWPWGKALMEYLGEDPYCGTGPVPDKLFNGIYRCPADPRRDGRWSYGKNCYYELEPSESPDTDGHSFPTALSVPNPNATVLFTELLGSIQDQPDSDATLDHFMAQFWPGLTPEVDLSRHSKVLSNYLFADLHIVALPFIKTFDPAQDVNKWNPLIAK